MAKFACRCGFVINLIVSPSKDAWSLIPEKTMEDIADFLVGGRMVNNEWFYEMLGDNEITVYRCPSCGRLHLEEAGRNKFVTYMREDYGE